VFRALPATTNADFIGFYVAVQENPLPEIPDRLAAWPGRRASVCHIFKTPEADCASNTDKGPTLGVIAVSKLVEANVHRWPSAITTFYSRLVYAGAFPECRKTPYIGGKSSGALLDKGNIL
jgi:hypothetical protein